MESSSCSCKNRSCLGAGMAVMSTTAIVSFILASTVWIGWVYPKTYRSRGKIELALFLLEVIMIYWTYYATSFRGPGFVPRGWAPDEEELTLRCPPDDALPLLSAALPPDDCLQYCCICRCHKPPRAHHCADCNRCVLWMDHHCPWTGTCIGYGNMRTFVQFVHYVPFGCLYVALLQLEAVVLIGQRIYSGMPRKHFFQLIELGDILPFFTFILATMVTILVGCLANDMRSMITNNITWIEELAINSINRRRFLAKEPEFMLPYDLGAKRNVRTIMGDTWAATLLPWRMKADAVWPLVFNDTEHFSLPAELIAYKSQWQHDGIKNSLAKSFRLDQRCCKCGTTWCWICSKFGCRALCVCNSTVYCGNFFNGDAGDKVLITNAKGVWAYVRLLEPRISRLPGWVPRACLAEKKGTPYEVPFQKQLQGTWTSLRGHSNHPQVNEEKSSNAEDNISVIVKGLIVRAVGSSTPFILREINDNTVLLGHTIVSCTGDSVNWSNGDTWIRATVRPIDETKQPAKERPFESKKFE